RRAVRRLRAVRVMPMTWPRGTADLVDRISDRIAGMDLSAAAAEAQAIARALAPRDSGDLATSIVATSDADSVTLTCTSDHAAYVQHGTRYAPAQPFMPLDLQDQTVANGPY